MTRSINLARSRGIEEPLKINAGAFIFNGSSIVGWFHPTLNLNNIDPECGDLDYIRGEGRKMDAEYVMSNNFAFAGINTSLIFKKWSDK